MDIDEGTSALHDRILALSGLDVTDDLVNQSLKDVLQRCSTALPQDVARRLKPYIWLETNQSEINGCDFEASLEKLEFLKDKESSSNSWIMFAKFLGFPVAVKLTAEPFLQNVKSHFLEIERNIYKNLINPILLCGFSPHLLIYYGSISCDDFFFLPEMDKQMKKLKKALKEAQNDYNVNKIQGQIIERAVNGTTLFDFITRASSDPVYGKELTALLFQLFYTLKVFSELGLSHNDLHSRNVFVVPATSPSRYYQIGTNEIYHVPSVFEIRIFDFDRGSKSVTEYDSHHIENFGLSVGEYCHKYGQCNTVNEKYEFFPIVFDVDKQSRRISPEINALIDEIAPRDILDRLFNGIPDVSISPGHTFVHPGKLCTCNNEACTTCTVFDDPRIKTLYQILRLDQFVSYKVTTVSENAFVWKLPSLASEETERNWQELRA